MTRVTVDLSDSVHAEFRIACFQEHTTMAQVIKEAVARYVSLHRHPSASLTGYPERPADTAAAVEAIHTARAQVREAMGLEPLPASLEPLSADLPDMGAPALGDIIDSGALPEAPGAPEEPGEDWASLDPIPDTAAPQDGP